MTAIILIGIPASGKSTFFRQRFFFAHVRISLVDRRGDGGVMSGNNPDYHFAGAGKPIKGGKGAVQVVDDYHLLRFAYVVCSVDRCGLAG